MGGCLKRTANCALLVIVLLALALGAAYYYVLPRLDEMLADAVRREFMLPPSSTVVIARGSLLDTLEGEVDRFYVSSPEAKISDLRVEEVEFHAGGIQFDLPRTLLSGQAELLAVSQGNLAFKVAAADLQERWATDLARRGLSKTEVTLEEDKIKVSCVLDLKLTEVRIGAAGELYVDGTDRIKFKATDLELAGSNIGIEELKAVFSTLTPVIDLGQFKMSVAIDDVQMRDGYLYVAAHSMSLEDKRELEAALQQQAEQEQQAESEGGLRLRIPTLDELKALFTEEPEAASGEEDGDAAEEGQEGEAGADGDAEAGTDDGDATDGADNTDPEEDGDDQGEQAGNGQSG